VEGLTRLFHLTVAPDLTRCDLRRDPGACFAAFDAWQRQLQVVQPVGFGFIRPQSCHLGPRKPGKDASAGPFYLIWQYPERSRVSNEQWPYMLEKLTAVQSPELRWPHLKVDAALPEDAPARRGEEVFVTQCLPCHRLNGGGAADIGPDLVQPMAATDYMTEVGLRALVRDPKSVRSWPQQQMPGFPPTALPDADLNGLIAYLRQIASQRRSDRRDDRLHD